MQRSKGSRLDGKVARWKSHFKVKAPKADFGKQILWSDLTRESCPEETKLCSTIHPVVTRSFRLKVPSCPEAVQPA